MICDEPVVLLDLLLTVYTIRVERSHRSLSSIESLSGNQEGGGDQQMMPELLNEAFSDVNQILHYMYVHAEKLAVLSLSITHSFATNIHK